MKAYIQVKQVGKRKCSIEKMPIDFPTPPASVQELIEAVVCWQVKEYNERLQQSEMLKYLTCEEMEDKAAAGKVGFEANYNGRPAVESFFFKQKTAYDISACLVGSASRSSTPCAAFTGCAWDTLI